MFFFASSVLLGPGSDEITSCPAPHHSSTLLPLVVFWSQRSPKIQLFSQGLALFMFTGNQLEVTERPQPWEEFSTL